MDSPHVFDEGGYGLELKFLLKICVYFSDNLSAILEISDFKYIFFPSLLIHSYASK